METKEIGGNTIYLKLGNLLTKWGDKLIKKGSKIVISNPTCKLLGPFALKLDFTVNNLDKYQLIIQGDYKDYYKQFGVDETPISEHEMFMLIVMDKGNWYLKNKVNYE